MTRLAHYRQLPYGLLVILIGVCVYLTPFNDFSKVFAPGGQLIVHGQDPYSLQTGYFLYWPLSFWFFPLTGLHPIEYYLLYVLNIVLLILITRRLKISAWWCFYPAALFTIIYGQLDILILFLLVEAYCRGESPISIVLVAAAIAIKPQTAVFWILPWLWVLKSYRQRISYSLAVGAVLVVPALIGLVLAPNEIVALWQHWYSLIHETSGVYVGNSLSLWSLGLVVPGAILFVLSLIFSRDNRIGRPMMALGMPAMGYYTSVVLVGALPTWGILVAYATIILTFLTERNCFWIEPVFILAYYGWKYWRSRQTLMHEQPSPSTS